MTMTQKPLARHLRDLADQVDAEDRRKLLGTGGLTLHEAMTRLRAMLPQADNIKIEMEMWSMTTRPEFDVAWQIWDGNDHFKAPTLQQAVELCLTTHHLKIDRLAEAEAALTRSDDHGHTLNTPATAVG